MDKTRVINISLDGPSGSGKTTIAKRIASKLGIAYLDTGAMYRAVGLYMFRKGIDVANENSVVPELDNVKVDVKLLDGEQKIYLNGEDVSTAIRENHVSMLASTVSKIKEVRLKLVALQREIASKTSCILDGRDIGSYVLPNADYKFYLTADADERARRRYVEIKDKQDVTLEKVKADMIARDDQDAKRAFAPLCIPEGAVVIDTTPLSIEDVEGVILNNINI